MGRWRERSRSSHHGGSSPSPGNRRSIPSSKTRPQPVPVFLPLRFRSGDGAELGTGPNAAGRASPHTPCCDCSPSRRRRGCVAKGKLASVGPIPGRYAVECASRRFMPRNAASERLRAPHNCLEVMRFQFDQSHPGRELRTGTDRCLLSSHENRLIRPLVNGTAHREVVLRPDDKRGPMPTRFGERRDAGYAAPTRTCKCARSTCSPSESNINYSNGLVLTGNLPIEIIPV